jgi:uncharacterized metal-binding protein
MQLTDKQVTILLALISLVIVGLVLTFVLQSLLYVGLGLLFSITGAIIADAVEESNKRKQAKRKVVYYIKRK